MPLLSVIAARWQQALPALAVIGLIAWIALFRGAPESERALFAALLVIYMLHQTEEHLWRAVSANSPMRMSSTAATTIGRSTSAASR